MYCVYKISVSDHTDSIMEIPCYLLIAQVCNHYAFIFFFVVIDVHKIASVLED